MKSNQNLEPGVRAITVTINPDRTRTYNSDEAFNPTVFFGEQWEKQVQVATNRAVIENLEGATFAEGWTLTRNKAYGKTRLLMYIRGFPAPTGDHSP